MSKIIIDNQSEHLNDLDCLKLVSGIIKGGRISNDGKQYCYVATLKGDAFDVSVSSFLNKKSDRFVVYDNH